MMMRFLDFACRDIWRMRLRDMSRSRLFFIRQLRIFVLTVREFDKDQCMLRASALTFFSLMSIVPVFAMIFGIAKGFGFEDKIEQVVLEKFPGQDTLAVQIIDFSRKMLENTSGGLIAGIGVAMLFWSVIKVLGSIEQSFNHIWGVKKPRNWGRKFSDYLAFMLIGPVLLVASSSFTVFVTSQITSITERVTALSMLAPLIMFGLKFLPYCVMWVLFTFIYYFIPNTRVNVVSALLAGVIAGAIFQVTQWGYVRFQIGAAQYGAIYGSFVALPLFLVWLQMSWLIVLFGAELSFAHQNVDTYEFEQESSSVSHSFKMLLSLLITHLLVKNFHQGEKPLNGVQISHLLDIPIRLVREILFELTEAGILVELKGEDDKRIFYQPGRDIEAFTIKHVMDALEEHGCSDIPVNESDELDKLRTSLGELGKLIAVAPGNVHLKDI